LRKKVVIIGSGRSGRGMLGELYDREGYEIIFADPKTHLTEGLREQGYYTVQMTNLKEGTRQERKITGYRTVNTVTERQQYMEALADTDLVSTALRPEDFDSALDDLSEAIQFRMSHGIKGRLMITLGANYVGLREYFETGLQKRLLGEAYSYYKDTVILVMSIVNRKNLLPDILEQTEDTFRIIGDDKAILRVDNIPELENDFSRPDFFRLEQGLDGAMAIKIWAGNLVQCSMAFVALTKGITNTYDAAYDMQASQMAYYASVEGYQAVMAQYGLPPRNEDQARQPVTVFRTKHFSDSLYRIVRDPIRKLGKNDRFIGPALCCVKHGIIPYFITRCCAYVFLYENEKDEQSMRLRTYLRNNGIERTVCRFCSLNLDNKDEHIVYQLIINGYRDICGTNPIE
jgi:mannitol-1-phosphate 5-dehydrogenase